MVESGGRHGMAESRMFAFGRHAVVTGASRGIGAAVARELAKAGANVTLIGRDEDALTRQVTILREETGGGAHAERVDVTDDAALRAAFGAAIARNGPVAILVNSAGQAEGAPFLEIERETWDRILAVNLTAAFTCSQLALPGMLENGGGRIVNIASTAALRGIPRIAAYVASKHGLLGLTRSLAMEVAKKGVTVNAVCPGYVDTDMARTAVDAIVAGMHRSEEEARRMIARPSAFNRLLEPGEVARVVAWLCSPDAATVTGQAIVIGGDVI
jgi:NAD(P)-dependent dehydrogenase (short-subunit alcohol dehydrogenase family)